MHLSMALPTMTVSIGRRKNGELPSTDFFSRLEEDYTKRGNQIVLGKDAGRHSSKSSDRRKTVNHREKKKTIDNLITDLLEQRAVQPMVLEECQMIRSRIPPKLPPANGWKLSAEDEVLFRYFCVGKPAVWISTKQFNRDVPWCLYGEAQSNQALRHAVLAKSAVHISRIRGEPSVLAYQHLDCALPLIQKALATADPDEPLICAVFYVLLTEASFGEFAKMHNHLKGMALMFLRAQKSLKGDPTELWHYMAESAGFIDSLVGLLGWPLVFPDELLPRDGQWLRHLMVTHESERWIQLDFKHVAFQRDLARYKDWAELARKLETHTAQDEAKIVEEGHKLIDRLQTWQQDNIPPYYDQFLTPQSQDDGQTSQSRRFLGYSRYQFESPLHAEIHLLFYTLILITTFVIDPVPGPVSQIRVDTAIKHCQCLAAMGASPSSLAPETRTFGQFFVRLTFDNAYPEEQAWAVERYSQEFHFSITPLRPVFYEIRYALEREWNVEDWAGGRK